MTKSIQEIFDFLNVWNWVSLETSIEEKKLEEEKSIFRETVDSLLTKEQIDDILRHYLSIFQWFFDNWYINEEQMNIYYYRKKNMYISWKLNQDELISEFEYWINRIIKMLEEFKEIQENKERKIREIQQLNPFNK